MKVFVVIMIVVVVVVFVVVIILGHKKPNFKVWPKFGQL